MTHNRAAFSPQPTHDAGPGRSLADCAVTEADAGRRAVAQPEHSYRTCFQRDRDRIVHCSAFRRLDFKTQVFVPHEHDHYRTRLTHTLEVAQIARTLGRALGLNEDLIEAVALAHDLGHPPFGHAGEAALDELMAEHGGFEHNRQSLRVVDYLEHPYPQFRGLNLTRVVRECLARHETRYDTPASDEFDAALLAPLEGQLVDLADEIAYTSADLEDALSAQWLTAADLESLGLWQLAWHRAENDAPGARFFHKRIRACKAVLSAMADDLLARTRENLTELRIDSPAAARSAGRKCVSFSTAMRAQVDELQDFLLREVYTSGPNAEKERAAHAMISQLFKAYLADPDRLPGRYRKRIETQGLHRVTCDYIAGMTDRFCQGAHAAICE